MSQACSGHCCRAFILSKPLAEIKTEVENGAIWPDWLFIVKEFFEIGELNPTIMLQSGCRSADRLEMLYSCRQYDHSTGKCRDYENRPKVCREHPEYGTAGRTCKYEGCTYAGV